MPFSCECGGQGDGAFHELDVTKLNNPAENLGHLHLESGMLNLLHFHFEMSEEASTGQVDGRYPEEQGKGEGEGAL